MMKPKFTRSTVHAYTESRKAKIEQILVRELLYMAEEGVNIARDQHTYMDQTGNLTSSIGYELYVNGKSYSQNFQPSALGSESGEEGVQKGKSLAAEIGPDGNFSLIFVAGMSYAAEVEDRGKVVLSSAYLYAEQEMPKLIARVMRLIKAA